MDQTPSPPAGDEPERPQTFISYAQNHEDVVLRRALAEVEEGTYVDVGAAHPEIDSVTAAFYARGWSGVNVEPLPAYAEMLRRDRPRDRTFACAASDRRGEAIFHAVPETGLSTLDGGMREQIEAHHHRVEKIVVELRPLDELLDEAGVEPGGIHFLKIDVEGAEGDVLHGLDLAHWRPWILVVESTLPMTTVQSHEKWESLVVDAGYQFCLFDGLNRFYVSPEHGDLAERLSYPAGVFDQPFRSIHVVSEITRVRNEEHEQLEQHRAAAAQERERLELDARQQRAHLEAELVATASRASALDVELAHLTERVRAQEAQLDADARRIADLDATSNARAAALGRALADAVTWRNEMIRLRAELSSLGAAMAAEQELSAARHAHIEELHQRLGASEAHVQAIFSTVSWRLTAPLRKVRRLSVRRRRGGAPGTSAPGAQASPGVVRTPRAVVGAMQDDLKQRLDVVAGLLDGDVRRSRSLADALERFEAAAGAAAIEPATVAWLACVAVRGAYPDEAELDSATRIARRAGSRGLALMVQEQFMAFVDSGATVTSPLEVLRDCTLVDVSHTATYDLHTGIQRVVRECTSRWLREGSTRIVQWNLSTNSVKQLSTREADRFRYWRQHMHAAGSSIVARPLEEHSGATVIPWRGVFVLPELVDTTARCSGYRALARSGVVRRFGMIGYDLIPMTASETVTDGMTANFGQYLSLVKHSTHLSAISHSAADEFRAFGRMLGAQGLSGPEVRADPLPSQRPHAATFDQDASLEDLDLSSLPLVLVVGSHEPRKNHLVVLEAAERMWNEGAAFELVFAGGSSWGRTDFGRFVAELGGAGRPVRVFERVTEDTLWALYHRARFSVFTSLIEGYGLPIAESLICGTPVITSNFGSMAEIAVPGGAIMVDPRDPADVTAAMRSLLLDDERLARLEAEAAARVWPDWDDYTASVWHHLVGDASDTVSGR